MSKGTTLRQAVREGRVVGLYRIEVNHLISVSAAGAAIGFGTKHLDDFPVGHIYIQGAIARIGFEKQDANIITTWSGSFSVGSTPTADATLTGTDANIIAEQAIGPAVAGRIVAARTPALPITPFSLDNSNGALELNLNMTVAAASITDSTTGVIRCFGSVDLIMGYL